MVQQLQSAESEIADFPHTTTMIGHVQSNKLSAAMDFASRIDTVDSLKLAQRIARRQAARIQEGKENAPYPILLQVNSSGSESQFGCEPTALIELANKIIDLPELKIEGVMTIGAHTPEREAIIRSLNLHGSSRSSCRKFLVSKMHAKFRWE
ncbi:alanine racemase [Arcanobacterium hippocoleae]